MNRGGAERAEKGFGFDGTHLFRGLRFSAVKGALP
jgi:hypothetical protein